MNQFFTSILESNNLPWLSAVVLGLMTAISPCPLATNITAIGFISKDIEDRHRVFINGLLYTLGRAVSYMGLAVVIFFGADQFRFSGFFQRYGEKFLGPLLLIVGIVMLDLLKIKFPALEKLHVGMQHKKNWSYVDALLLGIVFALAFCPYSGVLYFGMLIPMTVSSSSGLILPLIFAVATGLPVIIFSYLIAFALSEVGKLYNKLKVFELWFRRIVAIIFIAAGMYYIFIVYFKK